MLKKCLVTFLLIGFYTNQNTYALKCYVCRDCEIPAEDDIQECGALPTEPPPLPITEEPSTEEPTSPQTEEPTSPQTEEPTSPQTEESTSPQTEEPTSPQTEEPPPSSTEETEEPPSSSTEETEEPPSSSTEETEEPPSSSTEETEEPPSSSTEETEEPPLSSTEETEEPPSSSTEETEKPPSSSTEETEEPPSSSTEETEKPPSSSTEDTEEPPTSSKEETEEPPKSSTEETDDPPSPSTDETDDERKLVQKNKKDGTEEPRVPPTTTELIGLTETLTTIEVTANSNPVDSLFEIKMVGFPRSFPRERFLRVTREAKNANNNIRCIFSRYEENGQEHTVRGCSTFAIDPAVRCAEAIGNESATIKECTLCGSELCNSSNMRTVGISTVVLLLLVQVIASYLR